MTPSGRASRWTSSSTARDGQNVDISNRVNGTLIWDGYGPALKAKVQLSDPMPGLLPDTWHTYGLRWSPEGYTFYFDGKAIWLQTDADAPISQRSQYVILSTEIWQRLRARSPEGYGSLLTSTIGMQVDYVRAYTRCPETWRSSVERAYQPAANAPRRLGSAAPTQPPGPRPTVGASAR